MVMIRPEKFHGSLIGLLGKTKAEILEGRPKPDFSVAGPQTELLGWREIARDAEGEVALAFTARLSLGVVHAVGLRSDRYVFEVEHNEAGEPYLVGYRKTPEHDAQSMNWIALEGDRPVNLGVY